jgi:hypothetical protein
LVILGEEPSIVIVTADEFFSHWDEWFPRGIEGVIEASGEEASLEGQGRN